MLRMTLRMVAYVLITGGPTPGCATSGGGSSTDGGGDDSPAVDGGSPTPGEADAARLDPRNGFPGDFPELYDMGGFGAGEVIVGFGGDTTTDRAGNRAALSRRPVVLLHGNGTTTFNESFGMLDVAQRLRDAGYADAEIWAPSYLGQGVSIAETPTPHRTNIGDVRAFIDAVIEYLGVEQVDVVGHSLGCGLINGYLRGLGSDGSFDHAAGRLDSIGTVVCLGGALYGTGSGFLYDPEFNVDGVWTAQSLELDGIEDATPYGSSSIAEQLAPGTSGTLPKSRPFRATTALDGDSRRIYWVALWSIGDIVDGNLPNACGLGGADLNQGFVLPDTLPGTLTAQLARHGQLLKSADVFDAMLPYLDR